MEWPIIYYNDNTYTYSYIFERKSLFIESRNKDFENGWSNDIVHIYIHNHILIISSVIKNYSFIYLNV